MRYLLLRRHSDGREDAAEIDFFGFLGRGVTVRDRQTDERWTIVEGPHATPGGSHRLVVAEPHAATANARPRADATE